MAEDHSGSGWAAPPPGHSTHPGSLLLLNSCWNSSSKIKGTWWGEGRKEVQEGGDVYTHIADSLHCTAETNNIVKQLYSN